MELHIDLAFFSGDDLLTRGGVRCGVSETVTKLESASGHLFEITSRFEEPACPIEIHYYCQEKRIYKSVLRVVVHTSNDWESIDLAGIHTLGFLCKEIAEQGVTPNA
jgi:hypothetical protein